MGAERKQWFKFFRPFFSQKIEEIQIFIIIFGFSMKNAFKLVQTSQVLEEFFCEKAPVIFRKYLLRLIVPVLELL